MYFSKILKILACIFVGAACYASQLPPAPIPGAAWIVDIANVLSTEKEAELNKVLKKFEYSNNGVVTVLTVESLEGQSIEEFGIKVADAWKIGDRTRDDGIIFIIATEDRRMRIEVGYGLEDRMTDAISSRILNNIVGPTIRTEGFEGGITVGIQAIMAQLNGQPIESLEVVAEDGDSESDGESDSDTSHFESSNNLRIPPEYHFLAFLVAIPVSLIFSIAGLFQKQAVFFLVGLFSPLMVGIVLSFMTNETYGILAATLSFFVYIALRFLVLRSKWGQNIVNKQSVSSSANETTSSSESSSSSSDDSQDSSRGGGFGGGGASGSF